MDDQRPASLSPRVHEILREELGFSGVIVTDDLYMDGVRDFADDEQVAVMAVEAGNDLLCCTDFTVQIPAVVDAVKSGEIPEHRIDQSDVYKRQVVIKMGKITGFLEYEREDSSALSPLGRIENFNEFHPPLGLSLIHISRICCACRPRRRGTTIVWGPTRRRPPLYPCSWAAN